MLVTLNAASLCSRCGVSLPGPPWPLCPLLRRCQEGVYRELSSRRNAGPAAGHLRWWIWQLWCRLAVRPDRTVRFSASGLKSYRSNSQEALCICCLYSNTTLMQANRDQDADFLRHQMQMFSCPFWSLRMEVNGRQMLTSWMCENYICNPPETKLQLKIKYIYININLQVIICFLTRYRSSNSSYF